MSNPPVPADARAARPTADHADAELPSFRDLGVPRPLVASLAERGITEPFPIQAATLPDALAGRDVLGRGRTGSGKTVAFSVPCVTAIAEIVGDGGRRPKRPKGLILVPTRELANQVADTLIPLARAMKLRVTTIYGGVSQLPQVKSLRAGTDIVVATPGRLEDLIGQGQCCLDDVRVTVLDEADHLADLGFLPAVKRLLDQTPDGGQRLLFSATLDRDIDELVKRYLHDPVTHSVDPESSVPDLVHHVLLVRGGDKADVVRRLAAGKGRSLLFTRTKFGARKLAANLTRDGIPAVELHGNLTQAARARNLREFSKGRAKVLVATDIAARGIHVDDVELVVHVDPPAEEKAFLHRSGRTGRAGAEGVVVTLVLPNQRKEVQTLVKKAGITAERSDVDASSPLLAELAGPLAEPVFGKSAPEATETVSHASDGPRPSRGPRPGGPSGNARPPRNARPGKPRGQKPAKAGAGAPKARKGPKPATPGRGPRAAKAGASARSHHQGGPRRSAAPRP